MVDTAKVGINKSHYIEALTGLRFIAAFCVLLSHSLGAFIGPATLSQSQMLFYLWSAFGLGMTLFFILSGFVIHYTYSENIQKQGILGWKNFAVARFARLYPLYILCLGFSLFKEFNSDSFKGLSAYLNALPYYITLTQTWIYDISNGKELSQVLFPISWSISTEWFFYALYPLIFFLLSCMHSIRAYIGSVVCVFLLCSVFTYCIFININLINEIVVSQFGPLADYKTSFSDNFIRWLIYFSPYSRIFEFVAGSCAAAIFMQLRHVPVSIKERKLGKLLLNVGFFYVVILYLIAFSLKGYGFFHEYIKFSYHNWALAPGLVVIVFCCARYQTALTEFLTKPMIIKLGEASYSLYLSHMWILPIGSVGIMLSFDIQSWIVAIARMALTMILCLIISICSYRIIEVPCRAWMRKKLMRNKMMPA